MLVSSDFLKAVQSQYASRGFVYIFNGRLKMGRKCSTYFDNKSCTSGYATSSFTRRIFTFPRGNEREQWLQALPNYIDITKITNNMGICEKHWKEGYEFKYVQGGGIKPTHPPTEFGSTPSSLRRQSVNPSHSRNSEDRNVLSEERAKVSDQNRKEADKIRSWESLVSYCNSFDLLVASCDEYIRLCKLSDCTFPPKVLFSIQVKKCFSVTAYREFTLISLTDILRTSFQYKLTLFSQLDQIIERVESSVINFQSELNAIGKKLSLICVETADNTSHSMNKRIEFLSNQLIAHSSYGHMGKKYDPYMISDSVNLYLRSRNAYKALRSLLILPSDKTIRSFWGKFGSAGNENECIQVVADVFGTLQEHEKFVYISADEIYVKPSIRYRGGLVIGFAENQETPTAARTVLALMINFLGGTPAFVARISPVLDLKHEYLENLLMNLVTTIHKAGGFVFGVVTDNLSVNQKVFKTLREKYKPRTICSIDHPIENKHFSDMHLFYDTTHLMKNIRNNWITEKTKTLEFLDPYTNEKIIAKWADIVYIHKVEENNFVRQINIDYPTLYPNNFEKQKVQLVVNVFNEKTIARLKIHGKNDTARFVEFVTRMWNILNIKSPSAGRHLNDKDREKICAPDDPRLEFLLKMGHSFKLMDACKQGHRVRCLTNATANALHVTLTGIVEVTKILLKSGYDYVLPGKIQSDRIEAEFGIYRGSSGGNYFISTEQVVSSLSMQRLKLYNQLGIQQSDDNEEISSCCTQDLQSNDEDIELVENCYEESSNLNDEERSSLYYI